MGAGRIIAMALSVPSYLMNSEENPKISKGIKGTLTAVAIITAAGLLAAGVAGSFALIGGHASWAPHFMSAMNTAISSKGAWIPYAMTAVGGPGAFIATILAGLGTCKGVHGLVSCVKGTNEQRISTDVMDAVEGIDDANKDSDTSSSVENVDN